MMLVMPNDGKMIQWLENKLLEILTCQMHRESMKQKNFLGFLQL